MERSGGPDVRCALFDGFQDAGFCVWKAPVGIFCWRWRGLRGYDLYAVDRLERIGNIGARGSMS